MSEDHIIRSGWDGVIELVFNRPEKLNPINYGMLATCAPALVTGRIAKRVRHMANAQN